VKWRQRVVTRRVLSRRVDRSSLTCLALIPPGLSCYFAWHSGHLTLPLTFTLHVNHRAGTDGVTGAVALWPLGMPARVIVYPLASTLASCVHLRKNGSSYADICQAFPAKRSIGSWESTSSLAERIAIFTRSSCLVRDGSRFRGRKLVGKQAGRNRAGTGMLRSSGEETSRFQATRFAAIKVAEFKFAE